MKAVPSGFKSSKAFQIRRIRWFEYFSVRKKLVDFEIVIKYV